jgi:hypothetical protein
MKMCAVLVGRVPEGESVIVAEFEEVGETLNAQFLGLIRASADAIRAGSHGETTDFDATGSEFDPVRSLFGGRCGEEMVGEVVKRGKSCGSTEEEIAASLGYTIHGNHNTKDRVSFAAEQPGSDRGFAGQRIRRSWRHRSVCRQKEPPSDFEYLRGITQLWGFSTSGCAIALRALTI